MECYASALAHSDVKPMRPRLIALIAVLVFLSAPPRVPSFALRPTLFAAPGQVRLPFRIAGTPPSSNVLTQSDFTLLGFERFPHDTVDDCPGGKSTLTGRHVGGDVHLMIYCGDNNQGYYPYEVVDVGSGYTTNISTAPRATLYARWNGAYGSPSLRYSWYPPGTGGGLAGTLYEACGPPATNCLYPSGIWIDESTTPNTLHWSWWSTYNTGLVQIWSHAISTLDSVNTSTHVGTSTAYGQWRWDLGLQNSWYFGEDPIHAGKMCVGGSVESAGVTGASSGPSLWCNTDPPTPSTPAGWCAPGTEPCTGSPADSLVMTTPEYLRNLYDGSDNGNPTNHANCDGTQTGTIISMRRPSTNPRGEYYSYGDQCSGPTFGPEPTAAGQNGLGAYTSGDRIQSYSWINGTNKQGVLFFGGLWGSRAGVNAPITGTISALNGTVSTSTASQDQFGGYYGLYSTGTWVGTLVAEFSTDNGSNWSTASICKGNSPYPGATNCMGQDPNNMGNTLSPIASLTQNPATNYPPYPVATCTDANGFFVAACFTNTVRIPVIGTTNIRVRASAWTSGSVNITMQTCVGEQIYLSAGQETPHGCLLVPDTGPSTATAYPVMAIYNPSDLAAVHAGSMDPWEPTPELVDMDDFNLPVNGVSSPICQRCIQGSYYDSVGKRLFLLTHSVDTSVFGNFDSLLFVFSVDDSAVPAPLWPLSVPFLGLAFVSYRQTYSAQKTMRSSVVGLDVVSGR